MRRETASKASPTSLLLSYREMSMITSTKSTRISATPNTLSENNAKAASRCWKDGTRVKKKKKHTHSPKPKRHNHWRDLLPDVAANRVRVWGDALNCDGASDRGESVWTYWYTVSGSALSSFPSSICTSASSIFATFLTGRDRDGEREREREREAERQRERIHPTTDHLQSLSFSISHPFTPESEPGLKYTEDMVRLSFFSLRSELGISVF